MVRHKIEHDELKDVILDAGFADFAIGIHDFDFKDLMRFRVNNILLVSSRYDFYTLVDDGQITEAIYGEYQDLNLHYAPSITRVYSGEIALKTLKEHSFDLLITMMRVGDMRLDTFCQAVKEQHRDLTVVVLAYQSHELQRIYNSNIMKHVDQVFTWAGNRKLFLAIIKLLEDKKNAEVDCSEFGVRVIILVEDSPPFYSSFLPMIYTELIKQAQRLLQEGRDEADKLSRQRARPKILHATQYGEAWKYFENYQDVLLGVITDLKFPAADIDHSEAGMDFICRIREIKPDLPILVQSSKEGDKRQIEMLHAAFVNKRSRTLLNEVQQFMLDNFGFGDFIFRDETRKEIDRAATLRQLRDKIRVVDASSLRYHASRDHFSYWLIARTRFWLAREFRQTKVELFDDIEDLRTFMLKRLDERIEFDERSVMAPFSPDECDSKSTFLRIGGGSLGGKARGLAFIDNILKHYLKPEFFPELMIKIPRTVVICTDVFAEFMEINGLFDKVVGDISDEELIGLFDKARLPDRVQEDLLAYVHRMHAPLAIRSSSLLEDTLYQPFAGIYATVMIPNSNPSPATRFRELQRAVKFVYASTYLKRAKNYIEATGHRLEEEQMAVLIQRLAGKYHGRYYHPDYSGVARSYNYYPFGDARPADGIVNLALGLGKTIVDGGVCAQFCPTFPSVMPQFNTRKDYFSNSQRKFWALDLECDPMEGRPSEDATLSHLDIKIAEQNGTLHHVASTYDAENDMLYEGTFRKGTRVLNFGPILQSGTLPLAPVLKLLMRLCETAMNCPVEIEFAGTISDKAIRKSEFHFLQVRPMVREDGTVDMDLSRVDPDDILLRSCNALGNGVQFVSDVVYVNPGAFDNRNTREIAREIAAINRKLVSECPFLLIGPGRWGSADPFLGIPVQFNGISGACTIVETSLPNMLPDPSQGSHFFQNLTSFHIAYFTTRHFKPEERIDFDWLNALDAVEEKAFVRHVRLEEPLEIRTDGQTGRGVVFKKKQTRRRAFNSS